MNQLNALSNRVEYYAIVQQTVYTLACTGLDSSTVTESVTVNILPVFQER